MGVSPITFAGVVAGARQSVPGREVEPTPAVDATRMEDDTYGSRRQSPERGLEDEDEPTSERVDGEGSAGPAETAGHLDVLA